MLVGGAGERAALLDFSDEDESENFPLSHRSFLKKNLVCKGREGPEQKTAKFGKGQRCHVCSSRGILALLA